MILDFTISNFRSIREPQTISFEATKDTHLEDYYVIRKGNYRILKMAVILGANASGKSNVVRAFEMLPKLMLTPCENKTSKIEYKKFALDKEYADKDSIMIVNFICGEQKYRYEVHFNNETVSFESLQRHSFGELRPHKVFERTTDPTKDLSIIKWGDKYRSISNTRALSVNLLRNRTVFGAYQKSNVDISWMKEIVDWTENYLSGTSNIFSGNFISSPFLQEIISNQLSQKIIDKNSMALLLKKADIGIADLHIEKETQDMPQYIVDMLLSNDKISSDLKKRIRETTKIEHCKIRLAHKGKEDDVLFDFEEESGGTQRYYELSGLLLSLINAPKFLAIDELECRLHPDLYTHFISTFLHNAKESQIVFTTHAREFLADKDLFRDDTVWFTEKNDEGATELYSLADFGSDVLRDSTNRYNDYRGGRLGVVPRLEDNFFVKYANNRTDGEDN